MKQELKELSENLEGELHADKLMRTIYATDASVYKEMPTAVVWPKTVEDIKRVIRFARDHQLSVIPRSAGTSLAGQCVGAGIVVDISKYLNKILEVNVEERWVRLQPGVIRDELNNYLRPLGMFFGPNTSTANRAMVGGMVGNNSCGSTSIVYGTTRDHVLRLETILSDGSEATFGPIADQEFHEKRKSNTLEGKVYRQIYEALSDPEQVAEIRKEFPKSSIHRRNTGYAVDALLDCQPFTEGGGEFNYCRVLCGSEGTLAFTTEIMLALDPLPLPESVVVCAHFHDLLESMQAVQIAMRFRPDACELMDKIILDCTRENIEQQKNRFFLEGDPAAVLMIEFRAENQEKAEKRADALIEGIQSAGFGYAFPKVFSPNTEKVWNLRKAGLGVLANLPGDPKAVACIEDTAVDIDDLPEFIREFSELMESFGQRSVYYAHAGAGEIHLRPILDLKKTKDQQLFFEITKATAELVKKYQGSLSGEHGDGRVRAAFIPLMVGDRNYRLFREIKRTWDPNNIFNPGKIVDALPMNTSLRYEAGEETPDYDTVLNFSDVGGFMRMVEKCNGSGDCRKLAESGGTMCPSYMATRNEQDTTRARANALREFIGKEKTSKSFDSQEVFDILKLCLSCKGCTSECPSNVDMSSLKAEFLYQYYQHHRRSFSDKAFANIGFLNKLGIRVAPLANWTFRQKVLANTMKAMLGVAPARNLPLLAPMSLRSWYRKNARTLLNIDKPKGKVYFFCDEFTNYNEVEIGRKAIKLLARLGYEVFIPNHADSGRAHLSKGMLKSAQRMARRNFQVFQPLVTPDIPLIGIEPSAILTFRDEYPRLVDRASDFEQAVALGENALMLEEFIEREAGKGNITHRDFHELPLHVALHGHCHQKALSQVSASAFTLSLPENYTVEIIPSGCCGMAGSFGFEKNNYEISMKIGELVLFPAVRNAKASTVIAAPGVSCRQQIYDGTQKNTLHPAEILFDALK